MKEIAIIIYVILIYKLIKSIKKNKQIYQVQINKFNYNSLYKPKECIITKDSMTHQR